MESLISTIMQLGMGQLADKSREMLITNDAVYQQDNADLRALETRFEEMDVSKEIRMFVTDYVACTQTAYSRYADISYFAGIRDTITLLNHFGLIKDELQGEASMEKVRVKEPSELTKEEVSTIFEFVREAMFLSDEQLKAVDHIIPMTQELFEQCTCAMVANDCISGFNRLYKEFPDFMNAYVDRIERGIADTDFPEETEEEMKASWEKLCARIRATYGEDAI